MQFTVSSLKAIYCQESKRIFVQDQLWHEDKKFKEVENASKLKMF